MSENELSAEKVGISLELPLGTVEKLSALALADGKNMRSYIENLLNLHAEREQLKFREHPSPSGDEWWTAHKNCAMVHDGIEDMNSGRLTPYSVDDIKMKLGLK